MWFGRVFDEHAFLLQREGRISSYPPSSGQEAAQVGSAYALKPSDWMVQAFREHVACHVRGIPMEKVLLYWGGDESGSHYGSDQRTTPVCVPVATQLLHAVGIAHAAKIRQEKIVVLAYCGEGATSEGDFAIALNWAGVFKLPVVLLVQNNHYAISLPREQQTASETIAQKALAFGIDGIQVDGNDVLGVYKASKEAFDKARDGSGATLIEAVTYRLRDHTTADDASRYRSAEEVELWRKRDPLIRMRKFLVAEKLWDDTRETQLTERCKQEVDGAIHRFESIPAPSVEDMFHYTFAEMPHHLAEQLESVQQVG
jgi:pyruvate dehydrogenase E1 component alpha subunit